MCAHSLQGKKRFIHFNIYELNLKLYLNYCNPEIRGKDEDNLIFRTETGNIPKVVTIEHTQKKTLLELRNVRRSYVKHWGM